MAGYALAALPAGEDAPWHRVVNREGRISLRSDGQANVDQRTLLEREGIRFDPDGRIDLGVFRWLE
jgi:methylated-DNA-protein-cysteine methyltransferase-like protein